MRLLSCMYIPIDLHYYLLGMPLLIAKQSSISSKYFRDARRVFIHGCVYSRSSLSEACKVEKLVLRFGTEIWCFNRALLFKQYYSCKLCVDNHLFSPGPVECNSKVLMEQALVVGGLKQLICTKKSFSGFIQYCQLCNIFNIPTVLS